VGPDQALKQVARSVQSAAAFFPRQRRSPAGAGWGVTSLNVPAPEGGRLPADAYRCPPRSAYYPGKEDGSRRNGSPEPFYVRPP